MLRYHIQKLLSDKSFSDGRRVTLAEVAEATGINRTVLSRLANQRGYNTTTQNIDKLCEYFECEIQELVEYVRITE